jgi:hypothetical protein
MSEIKDGGPAFARPAGDYNGTKIGNGAQRGISARDYFAARFMPVIWQKHETLNDYDCALRAYQMADAMLRARGE